MRGVTVGTIDRVQLRNQFAVKTGGRANFMVMLDHRCLCLQLPPSWHPYPHSYLNHPLNPVIVEGLEQHMPQSFFEPK